MNPRHATPDRRALPGHARKLRTHRVRHAIALLVVAGVGAAGASAAATYNHLQGNITSVEVEHLLGDRPEKPEPDPTDPNAGTPVNILVIGSDTREDNPYATDRVAGERSDTTIVVHLSADRSRIEMVSIPRDSLVDIPECLRSDGTSSRSQRNTMFNAAFATGAQSGETSDGAACVQRTIESLTGVYIDHFVIVDMAGFVDVVDAVGGVPMCVPNDIFSRKAHLNLKAGQQVLDGRTALAYARVRTGDGVDGSDLSRIERQQALLASTARTVLEMNILTDVPELMRFLDATTKSLTISSGLSSIPDMAGLAYSVRNIGTEDISFMTIPNQYTPDFLRVVWTEDAATVWDNVAADRPITTGLSSGTPRPKTADQSFAPDAAAVCG